MFWNWNARLLQEEDLSVWEKPLRLWMAKWRQPQKFPLQLEPELAILSLEEKKGRVNK